MSSEYDGSDPIQRLRDIKTALDKIDRFTENTTRAGFEENELLHLAVMKLFETLCEAAYWFVKNPKGAEIVARNPHVRFGIFGGAGNVYRHQYGRIDFGTVYDDLMKSSDIAELRKMLASELHS